jgi:hypothetical protein
MKLLNAKRREDEQLEMLEILLITIISQKLLL